MEYARAFQEMNTRHTNTLVVLSPSLHPAMLLAAKRLGFTLLVKPDQKTLETTIEEADIVHLHYWNSPAVNEFLHQSLPPCRLVIWYRVFGEFAPHCITDFHLRRADAVLATSEGSLKLPLLDQFTRPSGFAPGIADFSRLENFSPQSHDDFNVTYVGTVNPAKMHPHFFEMSQQIEIPNLRILICGAGGGAEFLDRVNQAPRFDNRGFVENIREVLEISDVFGYPLCSETYATSEQSVQEAMWAGIPPVVFPHGGLSSLVEHEKTGLVVHSEQQYVDAIEYLFRNPSQRSRLAENARSFAQTRFRITKHAEQLLQIYQNLVDMPATAKQPTGLGPAERFLASLDESTSSFLQAVTIPSNEAALDESRREQVFYFLMTHGEGGINHYRNCHPEVPQFRLWTALALWNSNRESSIRELEAAEVAGLDVSWLLKTMRS
ncbi:MAG: glycosyltransferase family 4 protein [Pirellulaceae bacterium]|nr:glycosyltransferase family 4 protein [Planctomycetaceae bacterium]MDG2381236.1 glycosyltransferase family 4 protein [Pirellulaceae bacterium]